jgi:hypothetical protein
MIHLSALAGRKTATIFSVLVLVVFTTVLVAQNTPPPKEAAPTETGQMTRNVEYVNVPGGHPYIFPVVPGTPEWGKLQSYEEMLRVTEVPWDTLKNMSTLDVFATAMAYPNKGNFLTSNLQGPTNDPFGAVAGVKNIIAYSNVWQELLHRKDATATIVAFYQTLDPSDFDGHIKPEVGEWAFRDLFIEALLLQSEVLNNLTHDQSVALLQTIKANRVKMNLNPEAYGGISYSSPGYLAGAILLRENAPGIVGNPKMVKDLKGEISADAEPNRDFDKVVFSVIEEFLAVNKK